MGKPREKAKNDSIFTKTGGAYIPPAKLRMMQQQITDKHSESYQRLAWEALKKSINGLINKVNISNLAEIVRELFQENIIRGRGLFVRSIIQAQTASPTFTNVYAALIAVLNTKFPQIGELLLKRLLIQFRKGFRRNNKTMCLSGLNFIAHLVNQQVAHEILALEVLTLLLESPTNDSVEVAVGFLRECGAKLSEVSPRGTHAIFERLRYVLHEGQVEQRVQYMIEVMFATRKDGFKDHPAILDELDKVEEEDQYTHMMTLENTIDGEDSLNVFKFDPDFIINEEKYKTLSKEILDESSSDSDGGSGSSSESAEDEEEEEKKEICDKTETNMVELRKTIYLTIQSSLDFEECAHKLLKMELKPGQEKEVAAMILDCCAQQRTYEKFFGLLGQRFCLLKQEYMIHFQELFKEQYETIHRLEITKLRNVGRFFSHLLFSDAISFEVIESIKLNEDDTTSSSRIFIKILFQDLAEHMGLPKLLGRLNDETLVNNFQGLFPRDNPRNTRFAINFFTSIGLGGLTDELREFLKTMPKMQPRVLTPISSGSDSSSSDSSTSSSSDSSSSSSSSSTSSSSDSSSSSGARKKKSSRNKSAKTKKEQTFSRKSSYRERREMIAKRLDESDDERADRRKNTRQSQRKPTHEKGKHRGSSDDRDHRNDKHSYQEPSRDKDYSKLKFESEDESDEPKSELRRGRVEMKRHDKQTKGKATYKYDSDSDDKKGGKNKYSKYSKDKSSDRRSSDEERKLDSRDRKFENDRHTSRRRRGSDEDDHKARKSTRSDRRKITDQENRSRKRYDSDSSVEDPKNQRDRKTDRRKNADQETRSRKRYDSDSSVEDTKKRERKANRQNDRSEKKSGGKKYETDSDDSRRDARDERSNQKRYDYYDKSSKRYDSEEERRESRRDKQYKENDRKRHDSSDTDQRNSRDVRDRRENRRSNYKETKSRRYDSDDSVEREKSGKRPENRRDDRGKKYSDDEDRGKKRDYERRRERNERSKRYTSDEDESRKGKSRRYDRHDKENRRRHDSDDESDPDRRDHRRRRSVERSYKEDDRKVRSGRYNDERIRR